MLITALLIAALILFLLATINVNSPRINLTAAGLAFVALALLLTHWPK